MNKLPKVFVNTKDKIQNNNQKMFYGKKSDRGEENADKTFTNELVVRKKINEIMSSSKFVYKLKVKITTNEGKTDEIIVAKEKDTLVTLNNKYIPISSIIDIEEL